MVASPRGKSHVFVLSPSAAPPKCLSIALFKEILPSILASCVMYGGGRARAGVGVASVRFLCPLEKATGGGGGERWIEGAGRAKVN